MQLTDIRTGAKGRKRFLWIVSFVVVVLSFAYGFVRGLANRMEAAHAASIAALGEFREVQGPSPLPFPLPRGVSLGTLYDELLINGRKMHVFQVASERSPQEVLLEQSVIWKKRGMEILGGVPGRRGLVLALNLENGERAVLLMSRLPPSFRSVKNGAQSFGLMTYDEGRTAGVEAPEERDGIVPGVPLMPGGRGGAVTSAREPGGRAFTGVYTNPGSVEEGMDYYREYFRSDGWREIHRSAGEKGAVAFGALIFGKGREELTLLFSSRPDARTPECGVMVVRTHTVSPST